MIKKIVISALILLASCGYQPLYVGMDMKDAGFKKITVLGEKDINRKIISILSLKEDEENKTLNEITFTSKKSISETSKDSKGQVLTFKTAIQINIKIMNNQKVIKERNFSEEFSYNNKENKFDLREYQNQIENNLINNIVEELIVFIKT